jgi:hypothetical protein
MKIKTQAYSSEKATEFIIPTMDNLLIRILNQYFLMQKSTRMNPIDSSSNPLCEDEK